MQSIFFNQVMLRKNVHKWRDFYNPNCIIFHIPDPHYFSSGRSVSILPKNMLLTKVTFFYTLYLKFFYNLLKNQVIYIDLRDLMKVGNFTKALHCLQVCVLWDIKPAQLLSSDVSHRQVWQWNQELNPKKNLKLQEGENMFTSTVSSIYCENKMQNNLKHLRTR